MELEKVMSRQGDVDVAVTQMDLNRMETVALVILIQNEQPIREGDALPPLLPKFRGSNTAADVVVVREVGTIFISVHP
jgi:hypothetical protein